MLQQHNTASTDLELLLNTRIRGQNIISLSHVDRGMEVGARKSGLCSLQTADLLRFPHTTVSSNHFTTLW